MCSDSIWNACEHTGLARHLSLPQSWSIKEKAGFTEAIDWGRTTERYFEGWFGRTIKYAWMCGNASGFVLPVCKFFFICQLSLLLLNSVFLLISLSDPLEMKTSASAEWSSSHKGTRTPVIPACSCLSVRSRDSVRLFSRVSRRGAGNRPRVFYKLACTSWDWQRLPEGQRQERESKSQRKKRRRKREKGGRDINMSAQRWNGRCAHMLIHTEQGWLLPISCFSSSRVNVSMCVTETE